MRSDKTVSWKVLLAAGLVTVLVVVVARMVYNTARDLVVSWRVPGYSDVGEFEPISPQDQLSTLESSVATLGGKGIDAQQPIQSGQGPAAAAWDGQSRLNVLLMGLDSRSWEEGGGLPRTDTLILFTLDPATQSAAMLSIPRDLWVQIPGYGYNKINSAYQLGVADDLPGGGPGLTIATIEQFLEIEINYYAEVDFDAFSKFIDEIDGVLIEVPQEITIDPIGPNNTMVLLPGPHTMLGDEALAYARARNTDSGDFDRARRQQQVVLAIRDRLLTVEAITKLITKAPLLYSELSAGVQTNLSLKQVIDIALSAQKVPLESIKKTAINEAYVENGFTTEGIFILIPNPDKIRLLREEVFTSSVPVVSVVTSNKSAQALMQEEAAGLAVLNGTSVPGLASITKDKLIAEGFTIAKFDNADRTYEYTTLVDYTGNPYTLKYLIETLKVDPSHIFHSYNPDSEIDIDVNLGNDWAKTLESNP